MMFSVSLVSVNTVSVFLPHGSSLQISSSVLLESSDSQEVELSGTWTLCVFVLYSKSFRREIYSTAVTALN
ncbi:uncharacterized [Tachysurus ichikawai]